MKSVRFEQCRIHFNYEYIWHRPIPVLNWFDSSNSFENAESLVLCFENPYLIKSPIAEKSVQDPACTSWVVLAVVWLVRKKSDRRIGHWNDLVLDIARHIAIPFLNNV